jgi:hypothetical protein
MTYHRQCSLAIVLIGAVSLAAPGGFAQSFDGEWRGSGKCFDTTLPYSIELLVQAGEVGGKARALCLGRGAYEYNFRGQIDLASGTVTMTEATSSKYRYAGSINGRRMTFKGSNGNGDCEYTLNQVGVPQIAAVPSAPQPAPTTRLPQKQVPAPSQATSSPTTATPTEAARPLPSVNDGREAFVARGTQEMISVQRALAALGFYRGEPDGVYGPGTGSAIEAWQSANGIPRTGYLSSGETTRLRNQAVAALGGFINRPSDLRVRHRHSRAAPRPVRRAKLVLQVEQWRRLALRCRSTGCMYWALGFREKPLGKIAVRAHPPILRRTTTSASTNRELLFMKEAAT